MKNKTFNNVFLSFLFFCLCVVFSVNNLFADNIEAVLDSNDGTSAFAVQDSDTTEIAHIDSDGNITTKGCVRVDLGGQECSVTEGLIVDGSLGVGVTTPYSALHVHSHGGDDIPIVTLQNSGGSFHVYGNQGTPETVIDGAKGDICVDRQNGDAYIKTTDAPATTGWEKFATGIGNTANATLSNLTAGAVTVNTDLTPMDVNTQNLGSATHAWANLYANILQSQTGLPLAINAGTVDLSNQTVGVTLNGAVDALNFDSNTFSINALNHRVGIGNNAPATLLHIGSGGTPNSINGGDDVYIQNDLEVDGTIYGNISGDISGGYNPGFDEGSVVFIAGDGSITQNNNEFFWDLTNTRLYIGDHTATPSGKLSINVAAGPAENALDIQSSQTTTDVVKVSAANQTTANILNIPDADALTTGTIMNLVSNSADTSARTLVQMTNDNAAADNATVLGIQQDGAALALNVNATDNNDVAQATAASAAFTNDILTLNTNTADTGAFNFLKLTAAANDKLTIDQSGNIMTDGNLTLEKLTEPAIIMTPDGNDTDFWLGVTDTNDGIDNDLFAIGKGTTPGTNPYFTVDYLGQARIRGPLASDGVLKIDADQGTNITDRWRIKSLAATNNLSIVNNATEAMSLTPSGDLTMTGNEFKMGTNDAGDVLVADGDHFNPVPLHGDCSVVADGTISCTASSGTIKYNNLDNPDANKTFAFGTYNTEWTSTPAAGSSNFFTVNYTQPGGGGSSDVNEALNLSLTTNADYAGATLYGLYIDNNDTAHAAKVAGIRINNNDTSADSMPSGIIITATAADSITNAIDASDAEITNAINIGSNNILAGGNQITSTELNLLSGMSKVGPATTFITGTTGGSNICAQYDASGNLEPASGPCGGSTPYDAIQGPSSDSTIDFSTHTNLWTVGAMSSDFWTIAQTGAATGGDLVTFSAGDAAITSLLTLDNSAAVTMAKGLVISSNDAGAITDAIDASDDQIDNAINIGTNNIMSNGTAITSTELNLLSGMSKVSSYDTTFITGTPVSGMCAQFDADGNLISSGAACSGFPPYNNIDTPTADSTLDFGTYTNTWTASSPAGDSSFFNIDYTQPNNANNNEDTTVLNMSITPVSGFDNDTLTGMSIQYQDSGNAFGKFTGIKIDNVDTTVGSMTDGIIITSSGVSDGVTTGVNVSDPNINRAIDIGTNVIRAGGVDVSASQLGILSGMDGKTGDGSYTYFVTGDETVSGQCAYFDANGNLIGSGGGCGGNTAYDGIEDPSSDSTIAFAAHANLWTVGAMSNDFWTISQSGAATGGDLVTFAAGNAAITSLLTLDNNAAVTMAKGLVISSNDAGALTDAIDASDAQIENALNIGNNNILSNGTAIAPAELNLLSGMTGKSGVDPDFITGTAGSDGQCGQFNADGDLIGTACGGMYNAILAPDGNSSIDFSQYKNTWISSSLVGTNNFFNINYTQPNNGIDGDANDVVRLNIASASLNADSLNGLVIQYADNASNAVIDSAIKIDNAETAASTMTDGIIITSSGAVGGIEDAIDVSDGNITNAINIGANNVVTAGATIASTSLDVLGGMSAKSGNSATFATSIDAVPTGCAYFDGDGNLDGTGASCAGNPSLDDAYNNGRTITADSGAVAITVPNSSGNPGLSIDQQDINQVSSDVAGISIANSGIGRELYLVNTNAGTIGPKITFLHAKNPPAADDVIGKLTFYAYNAGASETIYSRISAILNDATNGAENGELSFEVVKAGSLQDALHIDENANVGIGNSNPSSSLRQSEKLAVSASTDFAGMAISTFSANPTDGGLIDINKSANGTINAQTLVSDGENIGSIVFRGSDGSDFIDSAEISATVDGTPAVGSMPGSLSFLTALDAAHPLSAKMTIYPNGNVNIGEVNIAAKLEVDTDPDDNVIALNVDQDDTTNNNNAVQINNAGTGNGMYVDQSGEGIAANINSSVATSDIVSITASAITTGNVLDVNLSGDTINTDTALINVNGDAIDTAENVKLMEISTTAANHVDVTVASVHKDVGADSTIKYDEGDDQWQLDKQLEVNNAIVYNSEHDNLTCGGGGSVTINWSTGNKQKITITSGTCTINFTAPLGVGNFLLKIVNGGAGTITWGSSPLWPAGTAPTWTASGTDIASFYYDGADYYGVGSLDFR